MPRRKASRPEPADVLVIFGITACRSSSALDPSTGVRYHLSARRAEGREPEPVTLDMEFADQGGEAPTPYEVLIHAALIGNNIRFTRQDGIAEQWRIMQPLLDKPPAIHPYAPGTWGPEAADKLPAAVGGWRDPWVVAS